jgi:hypothetical protein
LYPWTVFVVLGFAVCLRAYYLCESLHFVGGMATIFGPYFLVPWFVAVGFLMLERAITSGRTAAQIWALAAPAVWLLLANEPRNFDSVHVAFLRTFSQTLHGSPLYLTLLLVVAYYAIAAIRRVRAAYDALSLSLTALAAIGPGTYRLDGPAELSAWPLLVVAALQLPLAIRRNDSRRALAAALCLLAGASIGLRGGWFWQHNGLAPAACLLVSLLAIGAMFRDPFARWLQSCAATLMLVAGVALVADSGQFWQEGPWLSSSLSVLALSVAALVYGRALENRNFYVAAGVALLAWLGDSLVRGYELLRPYVVGLEQIALGAAFFLLAMLISLLKTRVFASRWPFGQAASERR